MDFEHSEIDYDIVENWLILKSPSLQNLTISHRVALVKAEVENFRSLPLRVILKGDGHRETFQWVQTKFWEASMELRRKPSWITCHMEKYPEDIVEAQKKLPKLLKREGTNINPFELEEFKCILKLQHEINSITSNQLPEDFKGLNHAVNNVIKMLMKSYEMNIEKALKILKDWQKVFNSAISDGTHVRDTAKNELIRKAVWVVSYGAAYRCSEKANRAIAEKINKFMAKHPYSLNLIGIGGQHITGEGRNSLGVEEVPIHEFIKLGDGYGIIDPSS